MSKKRNNLVLDLHNLSFSSWLEIEDKVHRKLDKFLYPLLQNNNANCTAQIIVGRGLNSKRFIEGKNPMRYYTENYLAQVGLIWKNGEYQNDGIIYVYFQ